MCPTKEEFCPNPSFIVRAEIFTGLLHATVGGWEDKWGFWSVTMSPSPLLACALAVTKHGSQSQAEDIEADMFTKLSLVGCLIILTL